MIKINIINKSGNVLPKYQTNKSAGMDIMAHLSESIVIRPNERV